ncbi:MAG: HU family DNA-binding protein [Candidatus Firestonebacteria bacterium]
MVRSNIIEKVAEDTGLIIKDAEKVVDTIFKSLIKYLIKGERIEIRGFGTFIVKQRAERVARNLKTNESLPLPARKAIFFKVSKELKNIK